VGGKEREGKRREGKGRNPAMVCLHPMFEILKNTLGLGHFKHKFQTEGASSSKHCRFQKTRVIALSCGIIISAVHCLALSQSTRMIDVQTVRTTTPKTALA